MASIVRRGDYQWQATIRRKGFPTQCKTFETKQAAQNWSDDIESEMRRRVFVDPSKLKQTTLGDLLTRYAAEVSPTKRSCRTELVTIRRFQRHPLALRPLSYLDSSDFDGYIAQRKAEGAAHNSIRLELALLSAMFTKARKKWRIPVNNFVHDVEKPDVPDGRERRLLGDEEERLLASARLSRSPALELLIVLAIETGMRAGNLVELRWEQVDFEQKTIFVKRTKNDTSLTVPLSAAAESALRAFPCATRAGQISTFYDSNGLGAAFRQARKVAGIKGLNFHDLRHEAASRIAPFVPMATLTKLMGWKSIAMAIRYYNPTARELVKARRDAEAARGV